MSAPFGYFKGMVDELLVVNRIILGYELVSIMNISCSKVLQTLLCFSFDKTSVSTNGSIHDLSSDRPSQAQSVSQDRFMPWCITRNDGGRLLVDYVGIKTYGLSWGFCTNKARLPGLGLDYDAKNLHNLTSTFEKVSSEFHLRNLPGCSNIPLIIKQNTAGRLVCIFTNDLRGTNLICFSF